MTSRHYQQEDWEDYQVYLRKQKISQNKGLTGKDSQVGKCYQAEWNYQKNTVHEKFENIKSAQKFVNRITKSKTYNKMYSEAHMNESIERLFAPRQVRVAAMKRSTGKGLAAFAYYNSITVDTKVGLDAYTILHELSHTVGHMHHGRSFRQCLVKLVSRFLGRDEAKKLKTEFKKKKLSFGNAREPMCMETWVAARNRLNVYRRSIDSVK
jgi:hypothetical protein